MVAVANVATNDVLSFPDGGRTITLVPPLFLYQGLLLRSTLLESVKGSESRAVGRTQRSLTETAETSELVFLNVKNKGTMPTGKR